MAARTPGEIHNIMRIDVVIKIKICIKIDFFESRICGLKRADDIRLLNYVIEHNLHQQWRKKQKNEKKLPKAINLAHFAL